jgi:hypothetical protein
MSQAEINSLIASETMMSAQPTLMKALQNSFEAQAHDQLISGLIGGIGSIGAGVAQFGITKMGESAAADALKEDSKPNTLRTTVKSVESKATIEGNNESALKELPKESAVNNSTNAQEDAQKNVAANGNTRKTDEEIREEKNKVRKQNSKNAIQRYQNFAQLAGTSLNGVATAAKSPFDMGATKNGGTASAVGTVIQGNQTAQNSNANMVQTYKEAFTNASQILAGIVSAQNH